MPTEEKNPKIKIGLIGKFDKMWNEIYIADGFQNIGCEVKRIPQNLDWVEIQDALHSFKPNILLYTKWDCPKELEPTIKTLQAHGMKTVCWLFDLYFNYQREYQVKNKSFFKSDFVFTTDGGQQNRFEELGINHKCIRQGIRAEECFIEKGHPKGIVFIGSDSPAYPYRCQMLGNIIRSYKDFTWHGRGDTDEVRGVALNKLFGNVKIVIGDSVYSPYYWSNRVVETLGRGGFLIHPEVEGIKEEYPYLVTYKVGNIQELKDKINYYLTHENERQELIQKNWQWVRDNYTVEKKCQELLNAVFTPHN